MSKTELKSAFVALKINKPFRLTSRGPSFQAPRPSMTEESPSKVAEACHMLNIPAESRSCDREQSEVEMDTVKTRQGENYIESKTDPVAKWAGFTKVPHSLLRIGSQFTDPIDFMIYLHLFTYSWGFGRETASMSLAQLEAFTRATRNTVRRSMERLEKQGRVQMVTDYEHARMSRKWRILPPERWRGPKSEQKLDVSTGSKLDTVKTETG